jgi:hypothetical protein
MAGINLVNGPQEENVEQAPVINGHSAYNLGILFSAIYLVFLCAFCIRYSVLPGPEFLFIFFLIYAASNKWTRRFTRDWVPFVTLFLAYEAMYGIVGNISGAVHVNELISTESQIFGVIPTLILQQFYRNPVFDFIGAFFYSLHFIIPTVFGFILWKYSPKNYWKYVFAFLICSYSALITFLVYPSAPPWFGVNASRILFQIDGQLGVPVYRTIFEFIQANPYAAFPSLHAMYPWLISLYSIKIKRFKALPILIIPIGVWFSAVYLGEHYVVDLIGGVFYSTFAFFLVEKLIPRLHFERFTTKLHAKLKFRDYEISPSRFIVQKLAHEIVCIQVSSVYASSRCWLLSRSSLLF